MMYIYKEEIIMTTENKDFAKKAIIAGIEMIPMLALAYWVFGPSQKKVERIVEKKTKIVLIPGADISKAVEGDGPRVINIE